MPIFLKKYIIIYILLYKYLQFIKFLLPIYLKKFKREIIFFLLINSLIKKFLYKLNLQIIYYLFGG